MDSDTDLYREKNGTGSYLKLEEKIYHTPIFVPFNLFPLFLPPFLPFLVFTSPLEKLGNHLEINPLPPGRTGGG